MGEPRELTPGELAMFEQAHAAAREALHALRPYCEMPLWWPAPASWWVKYYNWRHPRVWVSRG